MSGARRVVVAVACLVGVTLASGCFSMRTQLPGAVRTDVTNAQVVVEGRVDVEVSRLYLFWGLLPPAGEDDALALALRDAAVAQGGDGVANLVFDAYFTPLDLALQILTVGIVAPRTYRLRGDVVRLGVPPLPGRALLGHSRRAGTSAPSTPPRSLEEDAR